jgi:hypothetical protein
MVEGAGDEETMSSDARLETAGVASQGEPKKQGSIRKESSKG